MIYSDLFRSIKTVDESEKFVDELNILLVRLFNTQEQSFEKALQSISIKTAENIKEVLLKNSQLDNKESIRNLLTELISEIQKLKPLKLSLGFGPSQDSIDRIFNWVLKNLGGGIILDIEEDSTILGGATIEFQGRYVDFSLRKNLDETFVNKREEILNILR